MADFNASFTGPSVANVDLNLVGGTDVAQGGGDFTAVTSFNPGSGYGLAVLNSSGGQPAWPALFFMTKSDGDPSNRLGEYSGGGGTCELSD